MLSNEQKAEYVKRQGNYCPYCGSPELEGHDTDFQGGSISQEVTCLACDQDWFDLYTLTAVYESAEEEPS